MMDELVAKLRVMTECPVCLEHLKEPRMLPCQHSFCTECLEGLRGTGNTIRCPCCNKYTPISNGVRELPVDFRANSLLETLSGHEKVKAPREARAVAVQAAEGAVPGAEASVPQDAFQRMSLDERCTVCEEIPTVSKNLSCGHHLCGSCVQFLLPVGGNTLHCPTCSHQSRLVTELKTSLGPSQLRIQPERAPENSQLTFHPHGGKNAVVSPNRITAHRKKSYNDAIVLTSRHLKPNELFEVRLDKKVSRWSGSIEIGVTTHCPRKLALPEDIEDLDTGTWYMEGKRVHGGSTVIKTYKKNLDDLKVGECVGVQRRENGDLHFYIKGVDLGVAAHNVPADVYGVVSLYGNASQVTITGTPGTHTGEAKGEM